MALPKRKHSRSRRDKSRTHQRIAMVQLCSCPQCKKPIRPHTVCRYCGYYNGKQILQVETKESAKGGKKEGKA